MLKIEPKRVFTIFFAKLNWLVMLKIESKKVFIIIIIIIIIIILQN